MKAAAQTRERANEAIRNASKKYGSLRIRYGTGTCECGETERLVGSNYNMVVYVTICDQCGDDTLTDNEITVKY